MPTSKSIEIRNSLALASAAVKAGFGTAFYRAVRRGELRAAGLS